MTKKPSIFRMISDHTGGGLCAAVATRRQIHTSADDFPLNSEVTLVTGRARAVPVS
jgi:hypothetical protein